MLSLVTEPEPSGTDDTRLLRAVQHQDKDKVSKLLANGADLGISPDPMENPLCYCIMTSQYEIASMILNQLTVIRTIIMEHVPIDQDAITVVLEYVGNVHSMVCFGWSKVCQLGWTNGMADLKLLQLLILHGPRNVITVTSPDFGEHCLVSAIKNNCQLMIKCILCIFREELGTDLYSKTSNNFNQSLLYHIERSQHQDEIMRIFDDYHCRFGTLQSDHFALILSDAGPKYAALKTYLSDNERYFPILKDKEFQRRVREMSKESKLLLKEKRAEIKS